MIEDLEVKDLEYIDGHTFFFLVYKGGLETYACKYTGPENDYNTLRCKKNVLYEILNKE